MRLIFLILLSFLFSKIYGIDVDPAGSEIKAGVKKYKLGDFHSAFEHFKKAETEISNDPRLEFNKGTTFYKLGDYSQALEAFEKALNSKDDTLKAKTFYNLGNTYYKLGNKKKAIENYSKTLSIDPNFEKAKQNLEIVRREDKNLSNSENEENENQTDTQNQKNSQAQSNLKNQNKKQSHDLSNSQKQEQQLSPQEANRILESYKQDIIKRKKTSSSWRAYNEIFW